MKGKLWNSLMLLLKLILMVPTLGNIIDFGREILLNINMVMKNASIILFKCSNVLFIFGKISL